MKSSLEFHNINISYDKITTQFAYKNQLQSVLGDLSDKELKNAASNYLILKNRIFNTEVKELLKKLGVDIEKENDFIHYKADENLITEVKFDFVGKIQNLGNKSPWFYEVDEIAVNVHFNNRQNGRLEIFSDKRTSRIEITIIERNKNER